MEDVGKDADALAFKRDVLDWRNFLLVEQPNGDFAQTIVRQFLFDCFHVELLQSLGKIGHQEIADIAAKAIEAVYHRRHSGQWVIRLGDGTEESRTRTQSRLSISGAIRASFSMAMLSTR